MNYYHEIMKNLHSRAFDSTGEEVQILRIWESDSKELLSG